MSGFELNVEEALTNLRGLLKETTAQGELHQQQVPHYRAVDAGRGFADRGALVAAMFTQLHHGGGQRLGNLESTVSSAISQVERYMQAESAFARSVEGIDETVKETTA
ncbi:hypothetical protein [Corynebacterium pacaense]|uniref:hypothetical protein n=1 Tax=Corynebacterium pacaense TaxID=1816684 RepID=UPI0009BADB35|nr:hypothetical protein [Corynebacterium pacaense]